MPSGGVRSGIKGCVVEIHVEARRLLESTALPRALWRQTHNTDSRATMSGLRQARKTTQLASQLQQIVAGPSSRQLPSIVEGLTIRSEGVKGNAGAR